MANAMGSLPTTPTFDADPLHSDLPVLRGVDIPDGTLRIVQPITAVSPRPAPPKQKLTARPLPRDINYGSAA